MFLPITYNFGLERSHNCERYVLLVIALIPSSQHRTKRNQAYHIMRERNEPGRMEPLVR